MARTPLYSGKVRDIYDAGDGNLLFVASDRLSVFDVVLGETVPDKGRALTAISAFWFDELAGVLPNHIVVDPFSRGRRRVEPDDAGRAMLVRKADMLKIECIVRGYLSGSAWQEYKRSGTVNGVPLPAGMQESEQLPMPVFTPSTKAEQGEHDENINFEDAAAIVGRETFDLARDVSVELYRMASGSR